MTPIEFLLAHRDDESSRKDVALALLEVGRRYGAAREFNRSDLVRWFHDGAKRPRWFFQAALDLALAHGWTCDTAAAAEAALSTLQSRDRSATLDDIKRALGSALVDHSLIDNAWLSAQLTRKTKA